MTGQSMTLKGKTVIYTGYGWRGKSSTATIPDVREVMMISRDQRSIEGRWFWGGYQEFGFNATAVPRRIRSDCAKPRTSVH